MATVTATSADYIDPDSRFTVAGDVHVHYKRAGSGPPVLLLHGSGSSLGTYDRVVASLAPEFDVIRIDLPGFGLTGPHPKRDYTIATYCILVAAVLDLLEVQPAVVVGNSLGGNIAWNFALTHPKKVSALVLINATGYPGKKLPLAMRLARNPAGRVALRRFTSRRSVKQNLAASVGPASASVVTDELIDRVHAMMTRPGNQQAFIDLACTDQVDRTSELPLITAPTLVLRSASIDGQAFAADMSAAREEVNPGTGHLVPDEDPTWVADRVRAFIDHIEPLEWKAPTR